MSAQIIIHYTVIIVYNKSNMEVVLKIIKNVIHQVIIIMDITAIIVFIRVLTFVDSLGMTYGYVPDDTICTCTCICNHN